MDRTWGIPTFVLLLTAGLALAAPGSGQADSAGVSAPAGDSRSRAARGRPEPSAVEARRRARDSLAAAAERTPDRPEIWRDLAQACIATGQTARVRECLQRAASLAPDDPGAQLALARVWKSEWLASNEDSSLVLAIEHFLGAARLAPRDPEPRVALTGLALVKGNVDLAMRAARSAVLCAPDAADALLALGAAAYRAGALATADSAFRVALPRLPADTRRRFRDVSLIAGPSPPAAATATGDADSVASAFWRLHDPDLTTPENEAELNFLARVAQALILFRDRDQVRWDMRAQLFVRYGIPGSIWQPPTTTRLDEREFTYRRLAQVYYAPDELAYPYSEQIWDYPELGMRVSLWDRSLTETYELPVAFEHEAGPRPDPARVANRPDLVLLGDGLGVYRALPPGVTPMTARARISRFPADVGALLVAHLDAPGGSADSLWGSWVVLDHDGHRVARGTGALSISACDPTARRVGDFSAEVPPGEYLVDLAVDDHHGRRGVVHLHAQVASPSGRLALSDLVLLCGAQAPAMDAGAIRLEPDFEGHVTGSRSVTVYFEVDHLALRPDGTSRFAYTYTLRPVEGGTTAHRQAPPTFEAAREEENVGAHRRQFVSAPLRSLRPGTYDFEVELRDLTSGATARSTTRFVKD
jgi:tetratricopeptide (TPR) repeat protein